MSRPQQVQAVNSSTVMQSQLATALKSNSDSHAVSSSFKNTAQSKKPEESPEKLENASFQEKFCTCLYSTTFIFPWFVVE